ncbi:MAG: hypothetical protein KDJ65_29625 [Anaerolineae bacterium]|nr:hypothetical protein [Anaerolineae bacterium]
MKDTNQSPAGLFFEVHEITPVERNKEEGCELCRQCQLLQAFLRHRRATAHSESVRNRRNHPQT